MKNLFRITKEQDQHYRFELKNEAGQFLFSSIPFSNEKAVKTSIEQLQSSKNFVFERKTNYDGRFHFNLKTSNSLVLGNSSLFQSQAGMENGIKQMKKHLATLNSGVQ